ncbi:hypothetical protein F4X10_08130 [Candidatus Poribacteria bacterium]|nr:hypothetical protein [Candidatus Poribacteria bacterium]
MSKYKRWTDADTETLKRLAMQGRPPKEIAVQMGFSEAHLRNQASKYGIRFQHASKRKEWTTKEVAYLRSASAEGVLDREIAAKLNRTVVSIDHKRGTLGIRKPAAISIYNPQSIAQVIKFRMAGASQQKIADIFGVSPSRISSVLQRAGLLRRFDQRRNNSGGQRQSYNRWTSIETGLLRKFLHTGVALEDICSYFPNRSRCSVAFKAKRLTRYWRPTPPLQIPTDTGFPNYPIQSASEEGFRRKLSRCHALLREGKTDIEIAETLRVSEYFVEMQRKFLLKRVSVPHTEGS